MTENNFISGIGFGKNSPEIRPFDFDKQVREIQLLFESNAKKMNKSVDESEQKVREIKNMILADPAAPKGLDAEKLTMIFLKVSTIVGVNPLYIAGIAQQETHFNQKRRTNLIFGMMQLSDIVTKDFYERPQIYDKTLASLVKQHGSLKKVFAAKNKNPDLDLGYVGELLYKYKNPTTLKAKLKSDTELNILFGAVVFNHFLEKHNGNLRKALEAYNNSGHRKRYAQSVMRRIDNAQASGNLNVRS